MIEKNVYKALKSLPTKEIIKGFHGRMIHTDSMTMSFWEVEKGAALPEHFHIHEQTSYLLEGEFEFTVGGQVKKITAGDFIVIGSNTPHSGKALTPCTILDVFTPVREDYIF